MITRFPLFMLIGIGIGIAVGQGATNPGTAIALGAALGLVVGVIADLIRRSQLRDAASKPADVSSNGTSPAPGNDALDKAMPGRPTIPPPTERGGEGD